MSGQLIKVFKILKNGDVEDVLKKDHDSVFPRVKDKEEIRYFVAQDSNGNLYKSDDPSLVTKFDDQLQIKEQQQKRCRDFRFSYKKLLKLKLESLLVIMHN